MKDWKHRLKSDLEPVLREEDPRPRIGAYHDMPFAIFVYPPEDEFELRQQLAMLRTRLEQGGKRVVDVSLAECLAQALQAEGLDSATLAQVERETGLELTIETIHAVISDYQPLDGLVAGMVPPDAEPTRDIVFLTRVGALYPMYRTSSLLEQLKGQVTVPTVLFYPGATEGPAGLRFMGVLDAEHNYRPKIY